MGGHMEPELGVPFSDTGFTLDRGTKIAGRVS